MTGAATIALSRQIVLRHQLDLVAHNIANSNSTGFQGRSALFQEYLARPGGARGHAAPGVADLRFVQDTGVIRDTRSGPLRQTDNALDLALNGNGYFVIETPDGPRYTRAGAFQLDPGGQLVTSSGHPVLGEGDLPFVFAPGEAAIGVSQDGTVSTENGIVGRLKIAGFDNEQAMRPVGAGLLATGQAALPATGTTVVQGALEGSNVSPVVEIARMIAVHRAYASASRVVQQEDQRIRTMIRAMTRSA